MPPVVALPLGTLARREAAGVDADDRPRVRRTAARAVSRAAVWHHRVLRPGLVRCSGSVRAGLPELVRPSLAGPTFPGWAGLPWPVRPFRAGAAFPGRSGLSGLGRPFRAGAIRWSGPGGPGRLVAVRFAGFTRVPRLYPRSGCPGGPAAFRRPGRRPSGPSPASSGRALRRRRVQPAGVVGSSRWGSAVRLHGFGRQVRAGVRRRRPSPGTPPVASAGVPVTAAGDVRRAARAFGRGCRPRGASSVRRSPSPPGPVSPVSVATG